MFRFVQLVVNNVCCGSTRPVGPSEGQNVAGWKAASRATVVQLCQICPPTAHLTKSSTTSQPDEEEKIEKTGQELKMRESCVCVCGCVGVCLFVCLCDLMMPKLRLKRREKKNREKLE